MRKKEYLGDGAYIENDGTQVRIFCERAGGEHEVYLEPEAILEVVRFAQRAGLLQNKITLTHVPAESDDEGDVNGGFL